MKFSDDNSDEEKNEAKLKKKLEKYTKNIVESQDLSNQDKSVESKRINLESRKDYTFVKKVFSILLLFAIIIGLAYLIGGFVSGKIPMYDMIKGLFNSS